MMKFIILLIQNMILIYFVWNISKTSMKNINIARENVWIITNYVIITIILYIVPLIIGSFELISLSEQDIQFYLQNYSFIFFIARSFLQTIITWYFSIYAINKDFEDVEENANLQTVFAIEDFDVAMKSQLPVQYFKKFISENSDEVTRIQDILDGRQSNSR